MTAPTKLEVLDARLVLARDQEDKIGKQIVSLTAEITKEKIANSVKEPIVKE